MSEALKSRFAIGERAYFQANLRLVNATTGTTDAEVAAPCEIVAISFTADKVFYDLDVIFIDRYGNSTIESRIRVARVPSDMVAEGDSGLMPPPSPMPVERIPTRPT